MSDEGWDWEDWVGRELTRLDEQHLLRQRRVVTPIDAVHIEIDGRRYVNFSSNNYLGLTHHPRVLRAAEETTRRYGTGSAASPLITGYTEAHASAERAIARWKGTESAVLLPSGYQANLAAVQTLAAIGERSGRPVRFILDKLVHASLVDAVRETRADFRIAQHQGVEKFERLVLDGAAERTQIVVTESVFSMDGDAADLSGLAALKKRRPFILVLDEAHGSGVYGPGGAGLAAERGLGSAVDVTIVTLSKALGGGGGAVCGTAGFCEAVVNLGRAYIYSTHLPPACAAAAEAAIDVMRDEPQRQQRVRALAMRVREALTAAGLTLPPGDSPIIPIVLGNERAALEAARVLQNQGMWVLAIRPPTVPRGTSRLRVTLSSEHSDAEVRQLIASLAAGAPDLAPAPPADA
jgi:8-amino-7-oxononanoate synthase